LDENANGLQDVSELGVAGVVVKAYNIDNEEMGSVVSDETGSFNIDYLRKNAHYLEFIPPQSYGFTSPNVYNDDRDSDVDGANGYGTTALYPLQPGQNKDLDAGLVLSTLPLELTKFYGENLDQFNKLEWETEREVNSDKFIIERRYEHDQNFSSIAEMKAAGQSTDRMDYEILDYNIPKEGLYYYRLKQLSTDGQSFVSQIIAIDVIRSTDQNIQIYPNPSDGLFNIEFSLLESKMISIDLLDSKGKLIRKNLHRDHADKGYFREVFNLVDLEEGVYSLNIQIGELSYNKRMVIVR